MTDNVPILKLNHISKEYPGVTALDDVSLDFCRGEIHALVGENGAGKSTLIKVITGAVCPAAGTIEIDGVIYEKLTPHRAKETGIAVVYQDSTLIPDLSVAENIFLDDLSGGRFFVNQKKWKQRTEELFSLLEIDISPETSAGSLSPAECRMVEIAKAFKQKQEVLILDEPTAPLTEKETGILFRLIRNLRDRGTAVIYISHRLKEIYELADFMTIMRDGRIIASGKATEIPRQRLVCLMAGRSLVELYPPRQEMSKTSVFEVRHLNYKMLKDISFSLAKGEILGIAGLPGSGRTEVMEAIFGMAGRQCGEVVINGASAVVKSPEDAIKLGFSYLPSDRKRKGVLENLSIKENISLAVLKKISDGWFINKKREERMVQKYQQALRIKAPSTKRAVRLLSGGNQQKVVLSKWLASNSKIFMFDEPTQGVDVGTKHEIYQIMNQLTEEGNSVLLSSSDGEELLGMADRILVFYEGNLSGMLTKKEGFSSEKLTAIICGLEKEDGNGDL